MGFVLRCLKRVSGWVAGSAALFGLFEVNRDAAFAR